MLADRDGAYNRHKRGNVVWIWEARLGQLSEEDFNVSNTAGDSGKTAVVKAVALDGVAQARVQGVAAGSYVSVTVADQGIGMTDDVLTQVFDPFFTTKSADGCAGLGLTIAYDQVHGWSGKITAESSVGEGSTFEVLIPRHDATTATGA